jgi:hypothetical protein
VTTPLVIAAAPVTGAPSVAFDLVVGDLVVGGLVLLFLLYRQLRVRAVRSTLVLPGVLALLGLSEISKYAGPHPLSHATIATLVFSLLVFAIGLGAARAWTIKLWVARGQVLRQGTWVTIVFWLVAVGLHLAVDSATKVGAASLILYLGLSLGAQQLALRWRAHHLDLVAAST